MYTGPDDASACGADPIAADPSNKATADTKAARRVEFKSLRSLKPVPGNRFEPWTQRHMTRPSKTRTKARYSLPNYVLPCTGSRPGAGTTLAATTPAAIWDICPRVGR